MNDSNFSLVVTEYKNSIITIGCVVFVVCIIVALFVEFYVRNELDLKFLQIGKLKFSPTWIVIVIALVTVIYTTVVVVKCNTDISTNSYETYEGNISYKSRTVTLQEADIKVRVSSGHEIVPYGNSYGRCVYAKHSKVIVGYESCD